MLTSFNKIECKSYHVDQNFKLSAIGYNVTHATKLFLNLVFSNNFV